MVPEVSQHLGAEHHERAPKRGYPVRPLPNPKLGLTDP
jgi:hypothetical protein